MFQIGEIEIYPVSAGLVQVDGGGAFGLVPRVLWSRYLPPDDPQRSALHNEVHARPPARVRLPALIVQVGAGTIDSSDAQPDPPPVP